MAWYAVYATITGAAVSFTSEEPTELPAGLAYAAITGQPGPGQAWDRGTHAVVDYVPVPDNPAGALYEVPTDGWQWVWAIGTSRLPARAETNARTAEPTTLAAQQHIKANSTAGELDAALAEATARRERIVAALEAAGVADPTQNDAYVAASAALAWLGACL